MATKKTPARPRTRSTPKPRAKPQAAPAARKPSTASRALSVFSIGALAVAAGAGVIELVRRLTARSEGHDAPDLALDRPHPGPDQRAPEAFRPDPTAPLTAADRDALRPATMPAPRVVETQVRELAPG